MSTHVYTPTRRQPNRPFRQPVPTVRMGEVRTAPHPLDFGMAILSMSIVLSYTARATLLPHELGEKLAWLFPAATTASLLVAGVHAVIGGVGRLYFSGLGLLVATGASLLTCESVDYALPRWLGWCVLVYAMGPVNYSAPLRNLRQKMAGQIPKIFCLATVLSCLWFLAGLQNRGIGDFTGIMWHSMVLGPIAGFSGVYSLVRAFNNGSPLWSGMFIVSGVVCLLASSRAALAALLLGSFVVFILKLKQSGPATVIFVALGFCVALVPGVWIQLADSALPGSLTRGIMRKHLVNSREEHWEDRWDEFVSNPLLGVGFSAAWEGTAGFDEETGSVETGSSYVSLVSMTGCLGAAAFALVVIMLTLRVARNWHALPELNRLEICGMAAFWTVHLGAEGYIYASGSLLGITFWLWLGTLNDFMHELSARARQASQAKPLPFRHRPPGRAQAAQQPQGCLT